jgi:hypothetical protein
MPQKIRAQIEHARRAVRTSLCALAMAAAAAAGGCGDEGSVSTKHDDAAVAAVPADETVWLGLADDALPEEWLVRRKTKEGAEIDPGAVEAARVLLEKASERFGDQSRMIANRAAQLESMLADLGFSEDAMALIEALMRIAEGSKPTGGFAPLCQYYFNLRTQGLDREQALDTLVKRYGSGA